MVTNIVGRDEGDVAYIADVAYSRWKEMKNYLETPEYDYLFRYFFTVYHMAFTKGFATESFRQAVDAVPPLESDFGAIVADFLREGLTLLWEALPPSILHLSLNRLRYFLPKEVTPAQLCMVDVSQLLIEALHQFNLRAIQDMQRLWSHRTDTYARVSFFPYLPEQALESTKPPIQSVE